MAFKYRIPITAITVFGTSSLLALSVGIVLYLGFSQAAESTRKLWAEQSTGLIDTMESGLYSRLRSAKAAPARRTDISHCDGVKREAERRWRRNGPS